MRSRLASGAFRRGPADCPLVDYRAWAVVVVVVVVVVVSVMNLSTTKGGVVAKRRVFRVTIAVETGDGSVLFLRVRDGRKASAFTLRKSPAFHHRRMRRIVTSLTKILGNHRIKRNFKVSTKLETVKSKTP